MPFGAVPGADGVAFRLWAPSAGRVDLCLRRDGGERRLPLEREADGWFHLTTAEAAPGSRYQFLIDGGQRVPDPASRHQPEDVHGPSEVIDPLAFAWPDDGWRGRPWHEAVCYELHVGTFSARGDFSGVLEHLDHLVELGITAIELMPVADFAGSRGWGYDGVLPFAPESSYGRPEDLKRLVAAAQGRGLMVLLDVVYNHFGPEGNYLHGYAERFFDAGVHTPWGAAIDFREPAVRVARWAQAVDNLVEDYRAQLRAGNEDPVFDPAAFPDLDIDREAWTLDPPAATASAKMQPAE